MKSKKNIAGILYFFVHFMIEIVSFYILASYTSAVLAWTIAIVYDFFAFIPQGLFGYLRDDNVKINFAAVGIFLSTVALLFFKLDINPIVVIVVLAIGNCMIHVEGAETTLRISAGRMTPSALFVSGGSFGLITGQILAMNKIPIWIILIVNLLIIIPVIKCSKYKYMNNKISKYNYSNKKLSSKTIIVLATIVVIIRAYMGYAIPTSWKTTISQVVLLYCFMGVGKAMGGILIDSIGIRKTALLSTIGALPFLLFGDNIMYLSLIGVMMFSMTMAVTLALIVSEMMQKPGVAFGLTTVGLFLGTVPIFVYKVTSTLTNCLIVISLTVASIIILSLICRKEYE